LHGRWQGEKFLGHGMPVTRKRRGGTAGGYRDLGSRDARKILPDCGGKVNSKNPSM